MSDETCRVMLEWAPDIPPAWDVVNLKMLARIFAGGTPDRKNADYWSDGTIPWLNSGSVNDWAISTPSELIAREALANGATRWAPKGSVLVALAGQGKTKGMAARLEIDSTLNQSLAAIVPGASLDYRFLQYWLASNYLNIRGLAGGDLRDGLNLQHIGSIQVPRPLVEEQRAIADYLDRETAQIDAFIAKNEELIALLTERRSAAIDRAIAWGAAARAGTEGWLGGVPTGWSLAPLRRWVRFITSGSRGWGRFYSDQGSDVFLRIGDLQRDRLELRAVERQRVDLPENEEGLRARAREGDLLISITADLGSVAVVGASDAGAYVSQHVALVRIDRERLNPRFGAYVVSSSAGKTHFEKAAYGGTKIQLSLPDVKEMPIAVPSLKEQNRIVELLDSVTADVDGAIATARKAIVLARERRAALISASVTGKIDLGVVM